MPTDMKKDRQTDADVPEEQTIQECIDDDTTNRSTNPHVRDPHAGEDPGLLPLTEDPRERRLKRNTM